jgi:hypothetical protein
MSKYVLNSQYSPEKLIEHLGSEMGEGYTTRVKALGAERSRIYVRKNAAMGCTLRHVDDGGSMVYYGPFPYWSIWVPLVMLVGLLAVASAAVTLISGEFNVVIGGLVPVFLTVIAVRLLPLGVVKRVGSIMGTLRDEGR